VHILTSHIALLSDLGRGKQRVDAILDRLTNTSIMKFRWMYIFFDKYASVSNVKDDKHYLFIRVF
jgi:hypothetical protein